MKRSRLCVGGTFDHGAIGLLSIVLAGIIGSFLFLLWGWPGLQQASPLTRALAHATTPLLIYFCAVPASLGGLGVSSILSQVGSARGAIPWIPAAGFSLTVIALCLLIGSWFRTDTRITVCLAINVLGLGVVLPAVNLVTTILSDRSIPFGLVSTSVWTTLTAALLTISAAPIMAASATVAIWHGTDTQSAMTGLSWPALYVVLTLIIGLVSNIFGGVGNERGGASHAIAWVTGSGALVLLMVWAPGVLDARSMVPRVQAYHGMFATLMVPVEFLWGSMLIRGVGTMKLCRPPGLFVLGFAVVLPIGVLGSFAGHDDLEVISLGIAFGLFAGFFQLYPICTRRPFALLLVQLQFWLLLAGTITVLLPVPGILKVVGTVMPSVSVALFIVHPIESLVRRRKVLADPALVRPARPGQELQS